MNNQEITSRLRTGPYVQLEKHAREDGEEMLIRAKTVRTQIRTIQHLITTRNLDKESFAAIDHASDLELVAASMAITAGFMFIFENLQALSRFGMGRDRLPALLEWILCRRSGEHNAPPRLVRNRIAHGELMLDFDAEGSWDDLLKMIPDVEAQLEDYITILESQVHTWPTRAEIRARTANCDDGEAEDSEFDQWA